MVVNFAAGRKLQAAVPEAPGEAPEGFLVQDDGTTFIGLVEASDVNGSAIHGCSIPWIAGWLHTDFGQSIGTAR